MQLVIGQIDPGVNTSDLYSEVFGSNLDRDSDCPE
jgi:hypothetical protein